MGLNIRNWWNMVARHSKAERLGVRAKRYEKLSEEEKETVKHYWATGKVPEVNK